MSNESDKKLYKRPKKKTSSTTRPETLRSSHNHESEFSQPLCPLLAAKDSEWVDILQTPFCDVGGASGSSVNDEEESVLQLVECEDGPQQKPLAIMFPGLIEKDPRTLEGVLNKAMSTTEVTRHLVNLGQKANFTFMKKTTPLIPKDKVWLEGLSEDNSNNSHQTNSFDTCISSDNETEGSELELAQSIQRRIKKNYNEKIGNQKL